MNPSAEPTPSVPSTPALQGATIVAVPAGPPCTPPCAPPVDAATLASVMAAMQEQQAVLRRIQATLDQLLTNLGPTTALAPSNDGAVAPTPTLTVADPMGAGFTMSQRALADALAIPASYVSTLVRAFKLDEDPRFALTVRPGAKRLVNYHPRAVARFRELVLSPPASLDERARRTVDQVRTRLGEPAQAA